MDLQPLKNDRNITQPWLEKMLSLKMECNIKINFWSSTLPQEREGFLSEIAFVKVQYTTSGGEENVCKLVFKFLPQDPKLVQFLANGGLAKREVQFYQFISSPNFCVICARSGIIPPVPEAFYASCSDSAITIILRDLSVDHYKSVLIRDGSTLAQTKTALRAMALIHGAGILYLQQHQAGECLSSLAEEFNTDFLEQFFVPNMKTLTEMYANTSLAEIFKALTPLTKQIRSISKRHPLVTTVVHGDLWAGQLLYSADESSVSIIDWQFCHLDNPVSDIMSMFFMSTDPHLLEEHLEDIIQDYYGALCKVVKAGGGEVVVTLEQLVANVEEMWMYGFMFLAVSIHDFLGSDNISQERLLGAFTFLEKRGVFAKFLAEFGNDGPNGT
ncbi:hypothetical protein GWK47_012133 [Chionoecetes opilio]|uniref:CHK kinase-like domain-containing protein n=1 Tax=Chionoecetes opilio TaxID=41210 RepID=A0A8J5C268_CHIOP|nr:hypothetical protein GWK47_012133 [Chionoecetes opilio]